MSLRIQHDAPSTAVVVPTASVGNEKNAKRSRARYSADVPEDTVRRTPWLAGVVRVCEVWLAAGLMDRLLGDAASPRITPMEPAMPTSISGARMRVKGRLADVVVVMMFLSCLAMHMEFLSVIDSVSRCQMRCDLGPLGLCDSGSTTCGHTTECVVTSVAQR